MSFPESCRFVCTSNLHKPVHLPHLVSVVIGRIRELGISDLRCSRKQVILTADYAAKKVTVSQVGINPSEINGTFLKENESIIVSDGAIVDVRQGDCIHKIEFQPHSPLKSKINKRDLDDNEPKGEIESNKKPRMLEKKPFWLDVFNGRLLIYNSSSSEECNGKIAGFDLDGTIIKTKTGNVFPQNIDDWQLYNPIVKSKLIDLNKENYKIVIFTNQAGIGAQRCSPSLFKKKIESIVKELGVPLHVFIATNDDIYRKPAPGMWNYLVDNVMNLPNSELSFFVGDAAGRLSGWEAGKKKDFSMADRLFAKNIGLKFYTPEEYFFNKPKAQFGKPTFDPTKCLIQRVDLCIPSQNKEVIVMVGPPGSGKSHFIKCNLLKFSYLPVSRDNLHSWQKCVAVAAEALQANKSVVIDNTNPDVQSRKRYIDIAKEYGVGIRCFTMDVTIEHCLHNNKFREFTNESHEKISPIIIRNYRKIYIPPKEEEGFDEVRKIPFLPNFTSLHDEKLYKMFLLGS